ncbi:hypothetical protein [Draconibacterium sediminis]|uniref:Uncharacterized protein n=1 Tax=Draconibacterium sediminis TaxID=1544798 RepID=A0A0D8J7T2_9BACT|nr:hypothetical protein [Draconibacterium sediminis]KJF42571.1 hypothetical protein LH29_18665 [Draconibacterium sediminis]
MDNNKLFKFLLKDISEIEELFAEKGAEGFDELEIEFIRTRFNGAKHIIQLLGGKDVPSQKTIVTGPAATKVVTEAETVNANNSVQSQARLSEEEKESLAALSDFEEELKQEESKPETVVQEEEINSPEAEPEEDEQKSVEEEETVVAEEVEEQESVTTEVEEETSEEETIAEEIAEEPVSEKEPHQKNEPEDEPEPVVISNRIGDRVISEKSVNDLLSGNGDKKLEYKISNSPVKSIQAAIGINDRYQYIRELFSGNAETFAKTVVDLDNLGNIQEAVAYLQENFKWKKNETSLKFVNLVKRRFPNG